VAASGAVSRRGREDVWRLIVDGRLDGAVDMAVDRAMLASRADGSAPPTLRLYGWEVPTVSIGRFQKADAVDARECARRGFDVVRRPTGGRGVLHDDELTYSIVAGVGDGVPRGTAASYAHLCAALAEAYRELGVAAELTSRPRGASASAACYLHATNADLSLGAAKLSGSAQRWSGDAVLQHGSFVISRDVEAEAAVFGLDPEGADALSRTTATLASALTRRPSQGEVADAVVSGVGRALGVRLEPGELTGRERSLAERWADEHRIARADRAGGLDA
jgi:lipoate-protein ligase A